MWSGGFEEEEKAMRQPETALLQHPYCYLCTFTYISIYSKAFLVAQMVKNLPAMWETWVQSLGWEDYLEKDWLPTPVFLPGESHGGGAWWPVFLLS